MTLQYLISGIIAGIFSFVMFVRPDSKFWKILSASMPAAIPVVGLWKFPSLFPAVDALPSYFFSAAGWAVGFGVAAISLMVSSKDTGLKLFHILLGTHAEYLKDYENIKKQREELMIWRQKVKKQKKELVADAAKLREERVEYDADVRQLQRSKRELKASESGIQLKIVSSIPSFVNAEHVGQCATFFRQLCKMISLIEKANIEWVPYLKQVRCDDMALGDCLDEIDETIMAYLTFVAMYINQSILSSPGCRVHFRVKKHDSDMFRSIVAVSGQESAVWDKRMTEIPFSNSLIEKSWNEGGAPVVMSLNKEYAYRTKNSGVWQDYMTVALVEPANGDVPLFSFGISFDQRSSFDCLMKHLCHIRFDKILKDVMRPFFGEIEMLPDCLKNDILKSKCVGGCDGRFQ